MKILYIASTGEPIGLGGGSVALLNLIKEISKNTQNSIAVVFPNHGILSETLERMGIKCYFTFRYTLTTGIATNNKKFIEGFLRYIMMLYRRRRAIKSLHAIVNDFKPQIIHTNVGPLDIANNIATKKHIPHVWHIREYQDLDFNMPFFPSKKKFYQNIHHENNHLIAITKGIFKHFNMQEKDRVIYDGVFEKKKESIFNPIKEDYFLFVGNICEAKGVNFLIRVYSKYIKQGGKFRLFIAGEGPKQYKEDCLKFTKENLLADKIIFLGFRSDIYELMQKAIALIVPSKFEGFGFITAEAMYNKCLVIGRNTGGTKEQFDNGFDLFDHEIGIRFEREEELTNCLCEIDQNGINYYNQIVENAFFTVNELYNNKKHCESILNYYNEILDSKNIK